VLKAGDAAALPRGSAATVKVMPGRASPQSFVRNVSGGPRVLDVVDLVSGGDGTTRRRGIAIDIKTGDVGTFPPVSYPPVDGDYHPIPGYPVLDGCFLPDSRFGPTPVDSAGNAFEFPEIEGKTFQHIRTGGPIAWPDIPNEKFSARLGKVDYGAAGHGLLLMHSSKGLTLDLDAVRRLYPGARLARFRAVLGNTYAGTNAVRADAFVLADGKAKFERRQFTNLDKPAAVDVAVDDTTRFLTLAVTDGGDGTTHDWIIFGDPAFVLEKR
jgi:hypothetical protein